MIIIYIILHSDIMETLLKLKLKPEWIKYGIFQIEKHDCFENNSFKTKIWKTKSKEVNYLFPSDRDVYDNYDYWININPCFKTKIFI